MFLYQVTSRLTCKTFYVKANDTRGAEAQVQRQCNYLPAGDSLYFTKLRAA